MNCRSLSIGALAILVVLIGLTGGPTPSTAQRAQSPLEIGEMTHTTADGRSIIVVVLFNSGEETLEATGEFTLVDPAGDELARVPVSTAPIAPDAASALTVPIAIELNPGLYTATLTLEDPGADVRVNSGLCEIAVDLEAVSVTPSMPPAAQPTEVPALIEDDSDSGGFPSWLLLIIGLGVTVLGVTYMRTASSPRKASPRPIPAVSMVRKVRVATPPPKRPAIIKPLIPPRRRDPD